MRCEDRTVTSVSDMIESLKNDTNDYQGPVWFRGQSRVDWKLEPRLMRGGSETIESHLINRFKQNATYLLNQVPRGEFEWLFLMQHHSVPTRLLDWSESPLVALYFAVSEFPECDAAMWLLLPCTLNQISNFRPEFEFEVPSFDDEHLKNYMPTTISSERSTHLDPMAAIAPRNSSRMHAQQGVFTISHRENIYIEDAGQTGSPRDHIWRYIIPAANKTTVASELKLIGISRFQLFPELESLAAQFKTK